VLHFGQMLVFTLMADDPAAAVGRPFRFPSDGAASAPAG
jgi:hypothetical protein